MKPDTETATRSRVYGRRKGRPLRVRKTLLMKELLPQVQITLPEKSKSFFDPRKLFASKVADVWLEIGFGGGEHIAAQAIKHSDIGFIGCEPFVNGVASLLDHVEREGIKNVRIYPNDARVLMDALPDGSIARVFVLFPDPWPKARHTERRFIGPENLQRLARVMRKGATLDIASDDPQLQAWTKKCMGAMEDLEQTYAASEAPVEWINTRYEQKAIKAKRQPIYWRFTRK